jgi:hypothetical protein
MEMLEKDSQPFPVFEKCVEGRLRRLVMSFKQIGNRFLQGENNNSDGFSTVVQGFPLQNIINDPGE